MKKVFIFLSVLFLTLVSCEKDLSVPIIFLEPEVDIYQKPLAGGAKFPTFMVSIKLNPKTTSSELLPKNIEYDVFLEGNFKVIDLYIIKMDGSYVRANNPYESWDLFFREWEYNIINPILPWAFRDTRAGRSLGDRGYPGNSDINRYFLPGDRLTLEVSGILEFKYNGVKLKYDLYHTQIVELK